jgi:tetratricopeptide (TPR) repeat protein
MSGQGALMMVVGEPGIGKTAICDQLKTFVTLRGGKTLLGHCYEEGSLSLPYLAFVEAMRSYVLDREVKELREELGTGAADVARIVSEVRERLKVKPRPKGDPDEERYRLMQAVTTFLSNAAKVQSLLVVLEDLHDADKGTLDMLTHVSRHLAGTRLLIVGTYRDVEVDRSHPLSAALAELRRVSTYGRVILRGLNADEVRRMLESITQEEIPWNLAEAVHRQTEGNPLFVQEVVRYLAEEGLISEKEGRWRPTKDTPLEMNIPEGLRDVIGKRLSLLSKECNQLLSYAAVIGREFALAILKAVAGMNEDEFVNALKEAVQLSVLEERSQVGQVRYRFTHAFFRQTLYEEMIAPQRLKLHQQVARALEKQYADRLGEHAAELAEHFSHSTDPADLKKAIEYGEMAAKRATDVYAYGEAVRLLDQAVKVQKVLNPDDKEKICDLLIGLCEVLFHAGDILRVSDVEAPVAFSLAESIGDGSRAARACIWAMYAVLTLNPTQLYTHPQLIEWVERADRNAPSGTSERGTTDVMLGCIKCQKGDIHSGHILLHQAFDLGHKLGDQIVLTWATLGIILFERAPKHARVRVQMAEEFLANIHAGTKNILSHYGLQWAVDAFLSMGQRQRVEEVISGMKAFAIRTKTLSLEIISAAFDEFPVVMDGRLNDVINMVESTQNRGKEVGLAELANIYSAFASIRARLYSGISIETLEDETAVFGISREPVLCVVLAHLGRKEEASEILQRYVVNRPGIGTLEDETGAGDDVLFLEASVLVGHHKAAELLMNRLKDSEVYTPGIMQPTCVQRHLGGAAALLGKYDEARKYYQEAIKVCTEMPFRPELALSHLQLAELLLEHYPDEKKEALEHLDLAIKEFREMKMRPSLERALRHKDILKA